jgi:hypothetical protein
MTGDPSSRIELDDIQNGALHPRPSRYVGVYILLCIDDRPSGRELLRRLLPALSSATDPADPGKQAWVRAGLTFQGLKALGVPQNSSTGSRRSSSRAWLPRRSCSATSARGSPRNGRRRSVTGRARRARRALANEERLQAVLERARAAYRELPRHRTDLAAGRLCAAARPHLLRLQGWHQPSGH